MTQDRPTGETPSPDAAAGWDFAGPRAAVARVAAPRLLRGYALVVGGNGLAGLLSFALFILMARVLSPADLGAFTIFFTLLTLVQQVPQCIDQSFVRHVRADGPARARDYLRADLRLKAAAALALAALAVPGGALLARGLFEGRIAAGLPALAIASGAALSLFWSVIAWFQSRERYLGYALGGVSFYLLSLAALGAQAAAGARLTAGRAAVTMFAAAVLVGGAGFAAMAARAGLSGPPPREETRRMLDLGKWMFLSGLVFIVLQRIDVMVLGSLFDPARVGLYAAASRLQSGLALFLSGASYLYLPKAGDARRSARAYRSYWRSVAPITAAILAAVAALAAAAPILIRVFFGAEFVAAAPAARVLCLGQLPLALALPLVHVHYGFGDSRTPFLGYGAALAAVLATSLALTPRLGLTGPGWAYAAGYLVLLAVLAVSFARKRAGWLARFEG